ncbi:S8 family serine peptidase [Plantactinospora sp. B24E8]|uniref:S8 family serine peptidase n=1 Tax=Plantactinospora sp. B24E8 TaxID=3153567 RepID=UPI00325EE762
MRQRHLLAYGAAALTLAATLVGSSPTDASAQPQPVPTGSEAVRQKLRELRQAAQQERKENERQGARVVTLYTGDRVTVDGATVSVTPRAGVHFYRYQREQAQYVVPSDAVPLLRADRLDERLFNVTGLLEHDFDKLAYLPLVVSDADTVRGLAGGPTLEAVDGFATRVPVTDLASTWQTTRTSLTSGKIWLDGVRQSTLDVSVPLTGAPTAWSAGYDGTGVKVAVLDTGIDDSHPDLAGKVVARRNFVPEHETGTDLNGHGTHVSGTIAGTGAASDGRYKGVAPGASLLDGKVCWNDQGRGFCSDSAIIAAMQWAVESGAKVVNMSLGGTDTEGVDPLEQAVNDLTAEYGTLFVIAAGNADGWSPYRVASPSTADAALSVANWTKTGEPHWSSLPGPRIGDYAVKPDISAPGTEITSARSPSALDHLPAGPYFSATGTSMAAPHVAGAAALLAQAHPEWRAGQTKATLMASAAPRADLDVFSQGAGHVRVDRALAQPVTVTPPSLSIGMLAYPHTDAPVSRTMTYHNTSAAPVTLHLTVDGNAPDGLLTLSADTLTVPAGGTASVEVTADERVGGETYGVFSGRLVATADGIDLRTPFSVFREPPSASLHLTALDHVGKTPATVVMLLRDPNTGAEYTALDPDETYRVPLNSSWTVTAFVQNADGTVDFMANNQVLADRNRDVLLDGRKTRGLDITLPTKQAQPYAATVQLSRGGGTYLSSDAVQGDPRTIRTADLGTAGVAGVSTQIQAVYQTPPGRGDAELYQLGWVVPGAFTTGFTARLKAKDLAEVRAEYARNAHDVVAVRYNTAIVSGDPYPLASQLPPVPTPGRRTEYVGGNVEWRSGIVEMTAAEGLWVTDLDQATEPGYRAGRSYRERWNAAPLGMTLTPQYPGSAAVVRDGDTVYGSFTQFADASGHVGLPYQMNNHRFTLETGTETLGEFDFLYGSWQVGAEARTYRMRFGFDVPTPLVTHLESEWTFRSSAAQQGELPLTAVGFAPELALDNSARRGSILPVPLTVTRQATAGRVTDADVSVSYDDGRTWRSVPTVSLLGQHVAVVTNPSRAGHVSLRAHLVDSAGNTVTTTVLRAYEVR